MFAGALTAPAAGAAGAPKTAKQVEVGAGVVQATNAVRAKHGLPRLRPVRTLARAATRHSTYLATTGEFRHEDAAGRPFWARIIKAGYPRNATMAENIAQTAGCGPASVAQAMRMWMNSAPHRANILNPKLRAIGVGAVANADCTEVYFTVDFGSSTRGR